MLLSVRIFSLHCIVESEKIVNFIQKMARFARLSYDTLGIPYLLCLLIEIIENTALPSLF
jgi:hypothetical protein